VLGPEHIRKVHTPRTRWQHPEGAAANRQDTVIESVLERWQDDQTKVAEHHTRHRQTDQDKRKQV
jgi:hypothetical protein